MKYAYVYIYQETLEARKGPRHRGRDATSIGARFSESLSVRAARDRITMY